MLLRASAMGVLVERVQHDGSAAPHGRRLRLAVLGLGVAAVAAAVISGVARGGAATRDEAPPKAETPKLEGDAIELTAAFRDAAGIATTPATRSPLAPLVTVVGEAAFDPTRVAAVGTRASGVVQKVFFVEGQKVAKGDRLAEIESPGLAEAQADVRIAVAKKRAAELNAQREASLLARGLTTAREHEQAQSALAEQAALDVAARERVQALGGSGRGGISELRAPVEGILAERAVAPGQSVGPGLVAFRVGSLDRLWVLLRVYERSLQLVRDGDPVEIVPVAAPAETFQGTVAHVGAVIDPATHTADVRVEVPNEARRLRPGQAVKATIRASGPRHEGLSVPSSAVLSIDGAPTVFVAETPTRFVARKVELGIDAGDRVEIVRGVRDGEAVVSRSALALKSEMFR